METKVRCYKHKPCVFNHEVGKYYMEILDSKTPDHNLEVIGTLSWQSNPETENDFYGMTLNVHCGLSERGNLKKLYKILDYIQSVYDTEKPEDIKKVIGAEDYFFCSESGTFIPEKWAGYGYYQVLTEKRESYTSIIAPSQILADRKMMLLCKLNKIPTNCTLKFMRNVQLPTS